MEGYDSLVVYTQCRFIDAGSDTQKKNCTLNLRSSESCYKSMQGKMYLVEIKFTVSLHRLVSGRKRGTESMHNCIVISSYIASSELSQHVQSV